MIYDHGVHGNTKKGDVALTCMGIGLCGGEMILLARRTAVSIIYNEYLGGYNHNRMSGWAFERARLSYQTGPRYAMK